jgi:hypothetical protein
VPGLRVALTKPATKVDAFSRTETASLDLGRPIFTTNRSGRGVEILRSFGPIVSKRAVRSRLAVEELDLEDVLFDRGILSSVPLVYFVLVARESRLAAALSGKPSGNTSRLPLRGFPLGSTSSARVKPPRVKPDHDEGAL